jgi:hypothetical protein
MAQRLERAIRNIVYWMESSTPTSGIVRNRWELYDPNHRECATDSAGYRKFWVQWMGSNDDGAATDMDNREALHTIRLHVEYPTSPLEIIRLYSLIASDRHDIRKILRDQSKYSVGYKDDTGVYASTDTGIMNRWFTGDEINTTISGFWRFTSQLQFTLRESENV